ncbi:P-loop containing nucleoside triphosphate hydrolase protein [Apiospora arundinis]|uniref:P-loop containing nucleoside triphosphate hydrolase protein n=1 Tax=Apiospora arundinis TaxID=335852 RepID=A0ABR2JBG8_9PEZI
MAILRNQDVSDDEFDMIDPEPVSDLSTPEPDAQGGSSRNFTTPLSPPKRSEPASTQPAGKSTAHRGTWDTESYAANPASRDATGSDDQHTYASTFGTNKPNDNTSSEGIPGLKYTKSVYQKLWGGKDALIAVMGMTGAGKTTFISKVTGRNDLEIGHSLTSCTRDIQVIETKIDGQTVSFVDTPGFSDTHMSDTEVLQLIADYLAAAYKRDMKLSGIIYLHPISDTRVTHHATKNLQMFQKLTGEKNLKNVVLTTSMWDKVSPEEGAAREQELKDKFWKVLLAYQAKAVRYAGTTESAQRLVSQMLADNKPFYLQLQEEMGKDNKALRDTAAGREVMVELERLKKEHRREVQEMEELLRNSAEENRNVVEALKEHYHERLVGLEKTLRDERTMNEEAVRSLTERIMALESRGGCICM